jgi:hypothetical protein
MGVPITAPPNDGRDPEAGAHFHVDEYPVGLRFSGRKGANFIRLKLDVLDIVGLCIVEPQRELNCLDEPVVHRVPADACAPCDGAAAHAFNSHVGDAIECAPGTSKW